MFRDRTNLFYHIVEQFLVIHSPLGEPDSVI